MNGLKITNLTQETLLGPAFKLLKGTRTNFGELDYDYEECYKALSEKIDWDNPKGGDLTKPLSLVMNGNHKMVPVDYFFNNDLKYLQGGISTMTYTTSITKINATQYDLPGIEDMTFYGYAQGLESTHDVYSTKRILAVTRVEVMRKHGYGYLREIEVRRDDNDLYTFKEGDFLRHRINDIKDMLILIVQNRLTNLSGDDVDALRCDDTLTRLRTSLDDITKNIRMEILPHRIWSLLEKKRANIMIKAIDKQIKERRMLRSFEKFLGGRHYGTDLRLLQRIIWLWGANVTYWLKCGSTKDRPFKLLYWSYKVVRYRSKSKNKGKVPTEMEIVLEQTQQGSSYKVSVSTEGVEELKRKVKIKGEKKEALLTLRQKPG
ncbi:hypothetical protein Tco_1194588 [Tanacetum coccineum]